MQKLRELEKTKTQAQPNERERAWVAWATRHPYPWVTEHTNTFNEHFVEEGRPSAYELFPRYQYLRALFTLLDHRQIVWIEKSRDMMVSWACVAYLTFHAMTVSRRGVIFQTQKEEKVVHLVEYAKHLYRQQNSRIRRAFPLSKPLEQQPDRCLTFAHGGYVAGSPGGANQIRSYHPWGYLNDESSFQPEAGGCYNEALSAVKGKIIFNSSAGSGWYSDARKDIFRNE